MRGSKLLGATAMTPMIGLEAMPADRPPTSGVDGY